MRTWGNEREYNVDLWPKLYTWRWAGKSQHSYGVDGQNGWLQSGQSEVGCNLISFESLGYKNLKSFYLRSDFGVLLWLSTSVRNSITAD